MKRVTTNNHFKSKYEGKDFEGCLDYSQEFVMYVSRFLNEHGILNQPQNDNNIIYTPIGPVRGPDILCLDPPYTWIECKDYPRMFMKNITGVPKHLIYRYDYLRKTCDIPIILLFRDQMGTKKLRYTLEEQNRVFLQGEEYSIPYGLFLHKAEVHKGKYDDILAYKKYPQFFFYGDQMKLLNYWVKLIKNTKKKYKEQKEKSHE